MGKDILRKEGSAGMRMMKKMKFLRVFKGRGFRFLLAFLLTLSCSAAAGECAANAETVEIEYNGKLIQVDINDLILMSDGKGGEKVELADPEKYGGQYTSADPEEVFPENPGAKPDAQEITGREYEEEQKARRWTEITEDLSLREIDKKALELVKEYGKAKASVPPVTSVSGSVVMVYSSYTPKIVCRPMFVTDVILQPGETVTGVHPGDPVRWTFVPGKSGAGDSEQVHILIKPLMADISTNLVVNTDRRTYHLDLAADARNFIPSVSFSYPADSLGQWDTFIANKKKEQGDREISASGYSINPEDLHLDYEIRGSNSLRWKPVRVWDDGVKTYIQFKQGAAKKSVEAPVLILYEHKREVIANYRAAEDMYIVDRVFDKAALIAGTGTQQNRVVILRKRNERGVQ